MLFNTYNIILKFQKVMSLFKLQVNISADQHIRKLLEIYTMFVSWFDLPISQSGFQMPKGFLRNIYLFYIGAEMVLFAKPTEN